MGTEAPPPEDDDQAIRKDGLVNLGRRYLRRPYLIGALAGYVVLALLGLYASWKFWSDFDLDYLSYAGLGDYLLAPVAFLRLLFAPSFLVVLVAFTVILVLVAGCGGYLLKKVRSSLRHAWPGHRHAPRVDVLPLSDRWQDHETVRSYLRALAARPLWAAPALAIAAILAINVNVTAEKREVRSFARLIQHAYAKDRDQRLGAPYTRYELVALPTLGTTGDRPHLVQLRATDRFMLYYDVLEDAPLLMPADAVAGEVAAADPTDAQAPARAGGEAAAAGLRSPGGASDRAAPDRIVAAAPPAGIDGAPSGGALGVSGRSTGPGQIAPAATAGEPITAAPGSSPSLVGPLDRPAVGADQKSGAAPLAAEQPGAPAPGAFELAEPQPAAAGPATAKAGLETLGANLRHSQGSLGGLKSSIEQMEDTIVEIHKFIDELDGSLNQIDQAFGQLSDLQAAIEQLAYADCPEITTGQPLEFGANDATLSLEAVGWLFQSRRQLAARRSPEREEWLVIEGHADASDRPAAEPPLALRRAEAVRDFLRSELGVASDVVKVVAASVTGSDGERVSLYDCLGRRPAAAPRAPATAELGLVQSAAAGEVGETGSVRSIAWQTGAGSDGLPAVLADLEPRPQGRGLLVTVPGDRLFDTDSDRIETSAYGVLGRIGEALARAPERNALIIGHSDAIGEAAYNRTLSERRARAVRDFLVDRFKIGAARLAIEGRGEDEPIATNDTYAGRLANRRVDVLLFD